MRLTITSVEMPGLPGVRRRVVRRGRPPRRPGRRVPDLHAHDHRAVRPRGPGHLRRAQEDRRRVGPSATATPSTPASPAWASPSARSTARSPRPASPTRRPSATSGSSCSPSAETAGELDQDPLLVYGEKTEKARVHEGIDGEVVLKDSPLDPIADLVMRRVVDINWTERASTQVGRVIGPVPRRGPGPVHPPALRRPVRPREEGAERMGDASRALHDHLVRLPLRAARGEGTGPTWTSGTTGSSTTSWPSSHATRDEALKLNYDYIMGWETEQRGGPPRRLRPRAARQGARRRRRRRRGDVRRRRRHHRHGVAALRRRPRRGTIDDPELAYAGARAHNRFLAEICCHSPERRGGIALVPDRPRHRARRRARSSGWRAQPGIRGVMIPTMWHDRLPYNDAAYDPVWAACEAAGFPVAHGTRVRRRARSTATNIGIYLAEVVVVGDPADVAPPLLRRVRALPRPEVRASPRRPRTGPPT